MTADEYKSMHRKLVDYRELDDTLQNLKDIEMIVNLA